MNASVEQRLVYTQRLQSFLFQGDPDRLHERFWLKDDEGKRRGCALPVLLKEGWRIANVCPAAAGKRGGVVALVVLERPRSAAEASAPPAPSDR
jgi:hypothetical protein